MFIFDSAATKYVQGYNPIIPTFTVLDDDELISSEASEVETRDDAIFSIKTPAIIRKNKQIISDRIEEKVFTSITPQFATVSPNGKVTWVANGLARIQINTMGNVQEIAINIAQVGGQVFETFLAWEDDCLAKFCQSTVDEMIESTTASDATRMLFVNGQRNPDLFCINYTQALTAVAKNNSSEGQWLGFTAITPRHVIGCTHAAKPNGTVITFVDANNVEHTRTVQGSINLGNSDITLYLLNADLPPSIKPVEILPSNLGDYLRNPHFRVPALFPDRDNIMNIGEIQRFDSTTAVIFTLNVSSIYLPFYTEPTVGTSGKPVLVPITPNKLSLLMTFTARFNGPSYIDRDWDYYITTLEDYLGVITGYLPTISDLSNYTEY